MTGYIFIFRRAISTIPKKTTERTICFFARWLHHTPCGDTTISLPIECEELEYGTIEQIELLRKQTMGFILSIGPPVEVMHGFFISLLLLCVMSLEFLGTLRGRDVIFSLSFLFFFLLDQYSFNCQTYTNETKCGVNIST